MNDSMNILRGWCISGNRDGRNYNYRFSDYGNGGMLGVGNCGVIEPKMCRKEGV